jgi:hypothetical protein
MVMFGIILQTIKLREYIVAIANWCECWEQEWDRLMSIDCQGSIESSGDKIRSVRQLYRQQLSILDQLRVMRSVLGVARTLIVKRRI